MAFRHGQRDDGVVFELGAAVWVHKSGARRRLMLALHLGYWSVAVGVDLPTLPMST